MLISAIIAIGVAAAAPVGAQQTPQAFRPNWVTPVQNRERGQEIRPLREVVEELRSRFGGELINARLEDGGRPIYVIRWRMPDGQVRDFRVNAAR